MRYAINISDLTGMSMASFLLPHDVIPDRIIVDAEKGMFDGSAIMLQCDEERAKAIVDIIRMNCEKNKLRCYKAEHSTWKRI